LISTDICSYLVSNETQAGESLGTQAGESLATPANETPTRAHAGESLALRLTHAGESLENHTTRSEHISAVLFCGLGFRQASGNKEYSSIE